MAVLELHFITLRLKRKTNSQVQFRTSQGKPVIGSHLGLMPFLRYRDSQSPSETWCREGEENFPKRKQRRACQTEENNQHLSQTPGGQGEGKGPRRRLQVPSEARKDREMKSCRSQGGAVRKGGMSESLSSEKARQREAIGLRQCWSGRVSAVFVGTCM